MPKWYVVMKGIDPGVFDDWHEVSAQVQDATGVRQERFATKSDAEKMWRRILLNGWDEVLEPNESSGRPSNSSRRRLGPSQSLSAIEDFSDDGAPIFGWTRKYYVVTRGRRPGVFTNWLETCASVDGVRGAIHASYQTKDEAYQRFNTAEAKGSVRVLNPDSPRPSSSTNRYHRPAEHTMSAPPMAPVKVEDFEEATTNFGGLSISSAPAYRSSWNTSNERMPKPATPRREVERHLRFPSPQPLTQHRSLPSTTASPEGSLLLQRAHSEGYVDESPRGSPSQAPRVTVGSAPHLRGYTPRKQRMPTPSGLDVLSPLPALASSGVSLSSIDTPRIRAPTDSPTRSASRASTVRADTPPMVTAAQSPASDKSKKLNGSANSSPMPFDIRSGTSTFNGSNRTPRTPKREVEPPSDLPLAPTHVPFRFYQPDIDIRSPFSSSTQLPKSMHVSSFGRPSPSSSSARTSISVS